MPYVYNPLLDAGLDQTGAGGGAATTPGGSTTQVQFNDGGAFGGDADLTWNKTTNVLGITGDVNLNDGGTYTTTVQCVTPTANRTISFPDATGTVALVAGSSGQLLWNNAGANAGASTLTYDGSILTTSGRFINSYNATASSPAKVFTGTWFTGGTSTTTKPQVLIEPSGATSTAWSTSGTGLGVNAASGFAGNLLDLQVNGSSKAYVNSFGQYFGDQLTLGTWVVLSANGSQLRSTAYASWTNGSAGQTVDLSLARDAANTLAQRNGTNAQTFRLYNTFTDASNYERGFLRWSSNVFEVGPEAAGTGTTRPMRITAATLKLPNLPTYADNAAATTGGLVAGDVYKTATGELRITV
jgi:hypothetical protein